MEKTFSNLVSRPRDRSRGDFPYTEATAFFFAGREGRGKNTRDKERPARITKAPIAGRVLEYITREVAHAASVLNRNMKRVRGFMWHFDSVKRPVFISPNIPDGSHFSRPFIQILSPR